MLSDSRNGNWKKILGNIIIILTAYTLIQGIFAGSFVLYGKLRDKLNCIPKMVERIESLESKDEEQDATIKYLKGNALGFEKVSREEMEKSRKKKRKRFIGIF